jgi:hypothetical protein
LLPDLADLTNVINSQNATPNRARPYKQSRRAASATTYDAVDDVPLPEDEKALINALVLLQDKVAMLEREKAETDQRMEDYEREAVELQAQLEAQRHIRRSDSALGSSDGEVAPTGKSKAHIEKTRM